MTNSNNTIERTFILSDGSIVKIGLNANMYLGKKATELRQLFIDSNIINDRNEQIRALEFITK